MAKNINQIPTQATSILATDKMYIGRSPFGVTDDRYILGSDIIAQLASPLTTKGDLYTYSTADARLPIGTVDGQILQVNAAAATGLAWSTTSYPATTTINQILYSSAANTVTGITTANNGVLITSAGGVPSISSTLPTAVQDNITRLGTIVSGIWNGTAVTVPYGGTGNNTFTAYSVICAGTTATGAFQNVSGLGTSGQALVSNGAGALPSWQSVGAAYTPSALTRVDDTNVTLTLGGSPTTALLQAVSLTLGWTGTLSGTRGGTGVNNGSFTITTAGNLNFADAFSTSGAFPVIQTYTGATNVTFPTSGTLATTSQLPTPAALTRVDDTNVTITLGGTPATALLQATSLTMGWSGQLSLARGGSNANLTASNGGIVWSNATQMQILGGTATAGQMLRSGSTAAPSWSTATWPATTTANNLLYSSFNNTVTDLASANGSVLTTGATGVPAWVACGTSGNVLKSNGTTWVSATDAATNVNITDDTTTNATMYPTWVTANTGELPLKVTSTKLTYNPSTSLLTNIGPLGQITKIQSSAGLACLTFSYAASAVNSVQIGSNTTGNPAQISAIGSDGTIGLALLTKTSYVSLVDYLATASVPLRFYNAAGNQYTALKVADAQATTVTFNLPASDSAGFMISDGSANLSLSGTPASITGTVTVNGFSALTTTVIRKLRIGKMVYINFVIIGTSNSTSFTVTNLPDSANATVGTFYVPVLITNNGTNAIGLATIGGTTIDFYLSPSSNVWTNSGAKSAFGSLWYEAA